jgi:hypothetical protein
MRRYLLKLVSALLSLLALTRTTLLKAEDASKQANPAPHENVRATAGVIAPIDTPAPTPTTKEERVDRNRRPGGPANEK